MTKHTTTNPASLSLLFPAFILLVQFSTILLPATSLQAETRYVKPSSEIVVRRGQGTEYKIIAMIKNGTPVEFIVENGDFARIRLANGKEGWMLKRFLSSEPPLHEIVASLRSDKEEMHQRELETGQQLETISAILARTKKERDLASSEKDQLQASYTKLQQETADVVQIKNNTQRVTGENKALTQKLALLGQDNEKLRKDYAFKWFLAGGGVLLLGILIGRITGGSRRKRPSLL